MDLNKTMQKKISEDDNLLRKKKCIIHNTYDKNMMEYKNLLERKKVNEKNSKKQYCYMHTEKSSSKES